MSPPASASAAHSRHCGTAHRRRPRRPQPRPARLRLGTRGLPPRPSSGRPRLRPLHLSPLLPPLHPQRAGEISLPFRGQHRAALVAAVAVAARARLLPLSVRPLPEPAGDDDCCDDTARSAAVARALQRKERQSHPHAQRAVIAGCYEGLAIPLTGTRHLCGRPSSCTTRGWVANPTRSALVRGSFGMCCSVAFTPTHHGERSPPSICVSPWRGCPSGGEEWRASTPRFTSSTSTDTDCGCAAAPRRLAMRVERTKALSHKSAEPLACSQLRPMCIVPATDRATFLCSSVGPVAHLQRDSRVSVIRC